MNKKVIMTIIGIILTILIGFWGLSSKQKMPPEKQMFTIGIARWGSNPEFTRNVEGFKDGLAEKGYVEGKNVLFIIKNP